jgi:hypothetical protein
VDKYEPTIRRVRTLLALGDCALVTLPLDYNKHVAALMGAEDPLFNELCGLHRSRWTWTEVLLSALRTGQYGKPYPAAHVLVVGSLQHYEGHY